MLPILLDVEGPLNFSLISRAADTLFYIDIGKAYPLYELAEVLLHTHDQKTTTKRSAIIKKKCAGHHFNKSSTNTQNLQW